MMQAGSTCLVFEPAAHGKAHSAAVLTLNSAVVLSSAYVCCVRIPTLSLPHAPVPCAAPVPSPPEAKAVDDEFELKWPPGQAHRVALRVLANDIGESLTIRRTHFMSMDGRVEVSKNRKVIFYR